MHARSHTTDSTYISKGLIMDVGNPPCRARKSHPPARWDARRRVAFGAVCAPRDYASTRSFVMPYASLAAAAEVRGLGLIGLAGPVMALLGIQVRGLFVLQREDVNYPHMKVWASACTFMCGIDTVVGAPSAVTTVVSDETNSASLASIACRR